MKYAAFATGQKPQTAKTLDELARHKDNVDWWWSGLTSLSNLERLLQLKTIIQGCVIQLPDEKCEELSELFDETLRKDAQNISTSLAVHHLLLNEMLRSILENKHKIVENYGESGQTPEETSFETDTLYGKVFITIKDGIPGKWRKNRLQVLIDLPQINEKRIQELPPLWSELITSDKINPSWYLCQSKHGMIKFGCDGEPKLADGARLSLWCDSNGEELIVGTAHTTLKSNTTGQQQPPDPLSKVFRCDLESLSDEEVKTLYTDLCHLFEEIQGTCLEPVFTAYKQEIQNETLKTVCVKKFGNPTFLATVAVIAGLGFIWFKR